MRNENWWGRGPIGLGRAQPFVCLRLRTLPKAGRVGSWGITGSTGINEATRFFVKVPPVAFPNSASESGGSFAGFFVTLGELVFDFPLATLVAFGFMACMSLGGNARGVKTVEDEVGEER